MMRTLDIYVCENFASDYRHALAGEDFNDVRIIPFPNLCGNKKRIVEALEKFDKIKNRSDSIIMCSSGCDILRIDNLKTKFSSIIVSNYCFNHLISDEMIEYITEKGGYIVTGSWLRTWKNRLEADGFDRETARLFFSETCSEIVLLDTKVDTRCYNDLRDFSEYLGLPSRIINVGLEKLRVYLYKIVYEWRLAKEEVAYVEKLSDMRKQTAEYSAVLNIIKQLACFTKKRDVIDKMKELACFVFGATNVVYIDAEGNEDYFQECLIELFTDIEAEYSVNKSNNGFTIKISNNNEIYGLLEIGSFMFPQYMEKYINFMVSIARIGGLAISNAIQFELMEISRDEIAYMSFHDSLTGLYNRSYFNKYTSENFIDNSTAVFVCDVDGLKAVNDKFGHSSGDDLILGAANSLSKSFRDTDVVARLGGDEFVVIMRDCSTEVAEKAKQRINDQIDRWNNSGDKKLYSLSLSTGYAFFSDEDGISSWDLVFSEADNNMYEEKMRKKKR